MSTEPTSEKQPQPPPPTAAGAELEDARAHLAAIVESSHDAIISLTLEGVVLSWNAGAEHIYGYTAGEMIGASITRLMPSNGEYELARFMEQARRGERPDQHETDTEHLRSDGRTVDIALTFSPIGGVADEVVAVSVVARDISDRKRIERRLAQLANEDDLTGLANRRRFWEELNRHIDRGARYGPVGSLLVMDLDNLKATNDTLGHSAGDQLIRQVAIRFLRCVRGPDFLARLGGDEFGLLLPTADAANAVGVAERLIGSLVDTVAATTSIGIAPIDSQLSPEELLIRADVALYDVKDRGGDGYSVYSPALDARFGP